MIPLTIATLNSLEILDSRGTPTVAVQAKLSDGSSAWAQVPSGASTGKHEAMELRDGDASRYNGKGVRKAVANVTTLLGPEVVGRSAEDLIGNDKAMCALDGTANKSRIGANAILGVSCAVARALSVSRGEPLWQTLRSQYSAPAPATVPIPMVNILSGGLHAEHNIEFQDFLIAAHGFPSYAEGLQATVAVHRAARETLRKRNIPVTGVADEGGWGPVLSSNEDALAILTESIEAAGYKPLEHFSIALDVAASHFFADGLYHLRTEGTVLSSVELGDRIGEWARRYPIYSVEDALAEDDWEGWVRITEELGATLQLVGDDFFTTHPSRVRQGIREHAANAVLVKMNQIGTLDETFEVLRIANQAGYRAVVSARSGETEDSFLADLAVASGAGQIKVGSITRSERLAKYNRLLEIESAGTLPYAKLTSAG